MKSKLLLTAALIASCVAHAAQPVLVADANKVLDSFDEHQTVDFGGDGTGRRMVHAARKKGQQWHLIVYAQRAPGKWEMTADLPVVGSTKGLAFAGTSDENDEAPAVSCAVDRKRQVVFGWMLPKLVASNLDVIWTLDGRDRPVPVAGKKVGCRAS